MEMCYNWINLSLQGIDYYNTYYKSPLLFFVTLISLGWIVLLILETNSIKKHRKIKKLYRLLVNGSFLTIAAFLSFFINGNYFYNILLPLFSILLN